MRLITALFFLLVMRVITADPTPTLRPPANYQSEAGHEDSLFVKDTRRVVPAKPKVLVVSVNGMEWDFIAPMAMKGDLPNLKSLLDRGTYGRMRTTDLAVCPKLYAMFFTSTPQEENGIYGFHVRQDRRTLVNTTMLKTTPIWTILSEHGVSVGMANVPMTYPVQALNGYMISGMLTPGAGCDGNLCATRITDPRPAPAVYPGPLAQEIVRNVGNVTLDCTALPDYTELKPSLAQKWIATTVAIRQEQSKMFSYLMENHPTDFTWFAQACEDRTGHWLYPVQPFNQGFLPGLHDAYRDAFADQYRAFDKVLGEILRHVDASTYIFVLSDHGIKPLREMEHRNNREDHDHGASAIVAHHAFRDGDEVPGIFIAAGPNIKQNNHLTGWSVTPLDIAPTILSIYGIAVPSNMKGRVLKEIYVETVYHQTDNHLGPAGPPGMGAGSAPANRR